MGSGSDIRQRQKALGARFSVPEDAEVRAKAERAGVTVAAFIRAAVLDHPGPRATRRPPVETALLARLIQDLGPIADSLRQIAASPTPAADPRLAAALDDIADMSFACLRALGRGPRLPPGPPTRIAADFPHPLSAIFAVAAASPHSPPHGSGPSLPPPRPS
jgi:hypothetical protein